MCDWDKIKKDYLNNLSPKQICEKYSTWAITPKCITNKAFRENWKKEKKVEKDFLEIKKEIIEEKKDEIRELVEEEIITKRQVLKDLVEIKNRCMQREQVMKYNRKTKEFEPTTQEVLDSEGNAYQAEIWAFDANGALKACDLLGKHLGLYEEDNKQKTTHKLEIDKQKAFDDLLTNLEDNV